MKQKTYRSAKWLAAVRQVPECVACGRYVQVQAAHRNESKGMGMKADDCACAALCHECHHEIDNGNTFSRDERRELMNRYIVLTLIQLARMGLVAPT